MNIQPMAEGMDQKAPNCPACGSGMDVVFHGEGLREREWRCMERNTIAACDGRIPISKNEGIYGEAAKQSLLNSNRSISDLRKMQGKLHRVTTETRDIIEYPFFSESEIALLNDAIDILDRIEAPVFEAKNIRKLEREGKDEAIRAAAHYLAKQVSRWGETRPLHCLLSVIISVTDDDYMAALTPRLATRSRGDSNNEYFDAVRKIIAMELFQRVYEYCETMILRGKDQADIEAFILNAMDNSDNAHSDHSLMIWLKANVLALN